MDTVDLMVQINTIINKNTETEHLTPADGSSRFDIRQIGFDLLAAEFARVKRRNYTISY